MSKKKVSEEITQVINNVVGEKAATDLLNNLKEIGVTSISFIKIIIDIELLFDIEFADEDLLFDNFESVESLVNYVITKKNLNKIDELEGGEK